MYKTVISTLCALVAASLAIKLNDILISIYIGKQLYLSSLLSIVISTIFAQTLEFLLLHLPLRSRHFRQLVNSTSTIEGIWFEEVDVPDNRFSYVCIEYNFIKKEYIYYGINFDIEFNLNATFRSTSVRVGEDGNIIHYRFEAQGFSKERKRISGYGDLFFYKDSSRKFVRGEGYFVGGISDFQEQRVLLSKIDDSTIKSIIGKRHPKSSQDIQKLMKYVAPKMALVKNYTAI